MDPRRRQTIESLVAAAEAEFSTRPFEAVTVEEIAARAGVAVGSIYNNFGSKEGLHAAVVDRALDIDREYMDRAYTADRDPVEQLTAAADQYLRFYLEQPQHFRMLAFPATHGTYPAAEETARRLAERVAEQNARMADAIRRGIEEGSIRAVDPARAATVLWAGWNGIISLGWRHDPLREGEDGLAELLALAADLLGWGLRTGAEGAGGAG